MSEGPSGVDILIGLFMIFAGLCIALLGGGCTWMMLSTVSAMGGGGGVWFLLLSLAILAGGLGMIWIGFKMTTGGYRNGR